MILEKYFNKKNIELAWERVVRSSERDSKDYYGIGLWNNYVDQECRRLSEELISKKWKASRPFKLYMPKPNLMQRTITRLNIEDAIVYQAFANILGEKYYSSLTTYSESVFGSVLSPDVQKGVELLDEKDPNFYFFQFYLPLYKKFAKSVNHAVKEEGNSYQLATDITGFFDSIPHFNLLEMLSDRYDVEDDVLELFSEWFNQWSGTRENYTFGVGIPQGPQPSFFMANLLLYPLDDMAAKYGLPYYRYMDDIRIYSENRELLSEVLVEMDTYLRGFSLSLNSSKTSIEKLTPEKQNNAVVTLNFMPYGNDLSSLANDSDKSNFEEEIDSERSIEDLEIDVHEWTYVGSLENQEEIIEAAGEVHKTATEDIKDLMGSVDDSDSIDKSLDREFMRLASQFRSSLKILRDRNEEFETILPAKDWLSLIDWFPWRCNHFCWSLQYYDVDSSLKEGILDLTRKFRHHEWIVSELVKILGRTQEFTTSELRVYLRKVHTYESPLVREAWYKLLIWHSPNKPFRKSLSIVLKSEKETHIKKGLLYDISKKENGEVNIDGLFNLAGL